VGGGGRSSSAAGGFPHREGFALGVWEAEAVGGSGESGGEEAVAKSPAAAQRRARSAPAAFVELIAPRPGGSPECLVELEGPRGRMRVQFKGMATAELVALSRALWSGEA